MLGMMIFDLDKSNVMRNIRYLEPAAVKSSKPIPAKKYADSKKNSKLYQIVDSFPELIVITDGTESPIPRPKNKKKQKTHYSGKKEKTYTVQNQITVNLDGIIIHKSTYSPVTIMITKYTNQNILLYYLKSSYSFMTLIFRG